MWKKKKKLYNNPVKLAFRNHQKSFFSYFTSWNKLLWQVVMASMGYCKWWQVTDCEYGMFCLSTVLRLNTHRLKIKFSLDGYSVFLWQGNGSDNLQFLTWIIYLKKSFPILYKSTCCWMQGFVFLFVFKSKLAKYFSASACEKAET